MTNINLSIPDTKEFRELLLERLAAETAKLKDEHRAQRLTNRTLTADAKAAELHYELEKAMHDTECAKDYYHRVYRFGHGIPDVTPVVDAASVSACINTLSVWDRLNPEADFEIVFNSPGGSVIDGMELFDFVQEMRRKGHYITTAARGYAASMAGILLQAGDHRVMGRESYVMIHELSTGVGGKTSEIEDEVALLKRIQGRVGRIFAERSAEAVDNGTAEVALTEQQLAEGDPDLNLIGWKRRDMWLDSDTCMRFGIVDEVR